MLPENQAPFRTFMIYMRTTYFDHNSRFHYRLWNHSLQLLKYNDPDMTTNNCESINSGLNRDCPPLRTETAVYRWIYKHKNKALENYIARVNMNLLSSVKRPRIQTEKFEILYNLCADFNSLSAANREKNLKNT